LYGRSARVYQAGALGESAKTTFVAENPKVQWRISSRHKLTWEEQKQGIRGLSVDKSKKISYGQCFVGIAAIYQDFDCRLVCWIEMRSQRIYRQPTLRTDRATGSFLITLRSREIHQARSFSFGRAAVGFAGLCLHECSDANLGSPVQAGNILEFRLQAVRRMEQELFLPIQKTPPAKISSAMTMKTPKETLNKAVSSR